MEIVAYCPECRSRYQLHGELRGRRMRCPNNACRSVFTVVAAPESPESGKPSPPDGPAEVVDWRDAPPPVQRENGVSQPPRSRRQRKRDKYPVAQPAPTTSTEPSPSTASTRAPRSRGFSTVVILCLAIAALFGGGAWLVYEKITRSEETLRAEAERDYSAGSFLAAAKKYDELASRLGSAAHKSEYRFMAELAAVRDLASRTPPDPLPALEAAGTFIQNYARDSLLKERRNDLAAALFRIADDLIAQAQGAVESAPESARASELVTRSTTAVGLVERFPASETNPTALAAKIEALSAALATARDRKSFLDQVLSMLRRPKPDLDGARSLIRRHKLERDPAAMAAIAVAERRAGDIRYEPLNRAAQKAAPREIVPSLLLESTSGASNGSESEVVLAIGRGILYALDSRTGRRLWVARVGLDAPDLPLRIALPGGEPELVLVASADPPSLTARELRSGTVRWHQPLEAPILGRPVLARGRILAPTIGSEGLVYDLQADDGFLRGRFPVGQRLAAGAAFDSSTERLYVPSYGQYVFVFSLSPAADVAGPPSAALPRCDGLLPTGHAPGALRGQPIVISGDGSVDVPRYLVLGETDGIDAMKLRAFRLLDKPTAAGPTAAVRLPGWSWFAPYQDPEKLVLATDAGTLGLIGIQLKHNPDAPLLPLWGRDAPPVETAGRPGRAELVHADENGFWSLIAGRLQHWRLGLDRRVGPKLTAAWTSSLPLGSPVHSSQVSRDRSTLFLVTQSDVPAGHWCTAVAAQSGRELWRRPLGLTCQGDPMQLNGNILALDTTGAVYRFERDHAVQDAMSAGGDEVFPAVRDLLGEPQLLRGPDGSSAIVIACRADGPNCQLVLRRLERDGTRKSDKVGLPAALAGRAAVCQAAVILPLADGSLARVRLSGEGQRDIGPNWRGLGARPGLRCEVLHWQADDFLVTDGHRKIMRLSWPDAAKYRLDTAQAIELPARIVGSVARWPEAHDASPAAFVADANGSVHLIQGDRPRIERSWALGTAGERITAGPWIAADRVFVVVGYRRLIAIELSKPAAAWEYLCAGDGINVAPVSIDGKLVVSDQAGMFVALDPANGRPLGPIFRHPAEVAPTAAPAALGPGRLFAPLTDGAALILPLADLMRSNGTRRNADSEDQR